RQHRCIGPIAEMRRITPDIRKEPQYRPSRWHADILDPWVVAKKIVQRPDRISENIAFAVEVQPLRFLLELRWQLRARKGRLEYDFAGRGRSHRDRKDAAEPEREGEQGNIAPDRHDARKGIETAKVAAIRARQVLPSRDNCFVTVTRDVR